MDRYDKPLVSPQDNQIPRKEQPTLTLRSDRWVVDMNVETHMTGDIIGMIDVEDAVSDVAMPGGVDADKHPQG